MYVSSQHLSRSHVCPQVAQAEAVLTDDVAAKPHAVAMLGLQGLNAAARSTTSLASLHISLTSASAHDLCSHGPGISQVLCRGYTQGKLCEQIGIMP